MKTRIPRWFEIVALILAVTVAGPPLAGQTPPEIVAWGNSEHGQTNVPSGLSNVVAVAAGFHHSLGLTAEGKVVAWGDNQLGQTDVPSGLTARQKSPAFGNAEG